MVKVLGIDPGSNRTGWGLILREGTALRHLASGQIVARGSDLAQRLRCIGDQLDEILCQHQPTAVSVEGLFHHRNARSALTLGHARGVALLSVARADKPLFEYAPAEIKRAVTGNGRAPKEQVAEMVRLLLGYRGALPEDASDALAAAICHAHAAPIRERTASAANARAAGTPSPRSEP